MVNTNNTKFTFNKKGFALSLACVGLLATAGNADITPTGTVTAVSGTEYNVTVSNPSGSITVTDTNTSLGFVTNATVYINAGKALTIEGNGSIDTVNVWNASENKGFSLSGAGLTFNTKIETLNLGTAAQKGASGAITMDSDGALTIKNTVGTINLDNIIHTDKKGSGATITLDQATIGNFNFNQLITGNAGSGSDLNIKNTSGVITNFTIDEKGGYQVSGDGSKASGGFTLTNTGTIENFINKGLLEGGAKSTVKINNTNTIGTFENAGTINTVTITGGTIGTFTNTGKITSSTITANVKDFNNAGNITTVNNSNITVSNSFKNAEKKDFILNGTLTLQGAADVKDAKTTFDNAGLFSGGTINIVNNVLKFNNATTGTIKNSTISGAGAILTFNNAGMIEKLDRKNDAYIKDVFNNSGTITNSTINVGTNATPATTFTNAASGVINNSKMTVNVNGFENAGKITLVGSTITVNKTFSNTGTLSGGTIKLVGADSERNATFAGTNSGTIQASTISFSGLHKSFENSGVISGGNISGAGNNIGIMTFTNTATGVIKGSIIKVDGSDFNNLGSITAGQNSKIEVSNSFNNAEKASFILNGTLTLDGAVRDSKTTFNNAGTFSGGTINIVKNVLAFTNTATGEIKGTEISGSGTIQTLTNDGVMSVKANKANVAAFKNTKEFTLTGGTINVLDSFNNTEKAILTADANATIQLGNNKNANTTETTFTNAGTIDGNTKLTILTNGWVKSFTNTGLIDETTITSGGANGIVTFANSGTIDNSTLQVNVVNFNNLEGGLIDFRGNTKNSINLSGALDKTASFNNAGTINDLANAISVDDKVTNVSFKNSGSIYQGNNATTAVLNLKGASNLDFNNSGTIALASSNTSAAITATVAGAKANIINTGAITLGDKGAHLDLTKITKAKDAPFVVKEWHLSNIGSADAYNGKYTSDGTDKIVVKGFSRDFKAGTSNLRFDKGSIVIDPIKNPRMVSGQPYLLDRIVVNETTGAPVEEIHKDDGTKGTSYDNLIAAAYELNKDTNTYTLKAGATDPRLVTIDTIRSSDPIFEIYGVDAYASDGKEGEVITVSGATTTRKGDGIIDSFQVGVNASKSAGAAVVQSAVNNSITRNAFVGNVINTAVNSALASLNNLNRVSYNDEEVDFSELEKYAAVSSDVTDQTYAKDSNVYVMPYYRSTSVDLATNDSLDADTYGIVLGGNKNLGNAGVIGLFLGYENSDGSADKIDTEDDTFFGGINYYKTLGGTSSYDYFVKGMARLAKTSTDVTTKVNSGTSSADTFSYGVEANVGMNFYNGIHTFTPEVGLSYDRVSVDGFIQSNGLSNDDQDINLVIGKVGINWLAQFTESLSTNVGVGIRYNFNDDFDANIGTGNQRYSATTDLGDFYYYVNLGVNYAITQNWELGVMYNGDFSSDASSHSGFVKLGYWW